MFKRKPSEPPTLAETLGIDLDFRPRDYFWARDHDLALPSDIAGHERREMVKRLIAAGEEVPDGLDASRLEPELREAWGAMHPMNMGGEYLPPMFDGEVEIARISLRPSPATRSACARGAAAVTSSTASSTSTRKAGRPTCRTRGPRPAG